MSDATKKRITKKPGRPKGSIGASPAMVVTALRLPAGLTAEIDEWAGAVGRSRSEVIRLWIENGLGEKAPRVRGKAGGAGHAGKQIDRLSDQSASLKDQASRKRRLLKGPEEFRGMRGKPKRK